MKQNIAPFIWPERLKQLFLRMKVMTYLTHLYYDYIKHQKSVGKRQGWILDY